MDFLLECIGFSPEVGEDDLVRLVRETGEPAAWRGSADEHRLLALGDGLEVRADLDPAGGFWSLSPSFRTPHRRRIAITSIVRPPDSPFDALLTGWADPPAVETEPGDAPGAYRLTTWISDARRIDRRLEPGHVLAVSVVGFALNVERIVPAGEPSQRSILERPSGALVRPLGGPDDPAGCCDVSLRIRAVQHLRNKVTRATVAILECDAPDRPLTLLVSPWQLERDGLASPRPGLRVEGTFLFTGRIAGGLKRPVPREFG